MTAAARIVLLPCPFCGGPPVMHSDQPDFLVAGFDGDMCEAHVWCHECGAQGPTIDEFICEPSEVEEIERKAAEAWNIRDDRHCSMYDAGTANGLNLYPEPSQ